MFMRQILDKMGSIAECVSVTFIISLKSVYSFCAQFQMFAQNPCDSSENSIHDWGRTICFISHSALKCECFGLIECCLDSHVVVDVVVDVFLSL